jgi:hypothetical protein
MKKIIYTRQDGALSVINPVRNTHPRLEDLTDDEVLQRAMKDIPQDAINPQIVDESEIPKDRTFRNAWKANGNKVEHDMPKCREIHKDKLRQERKPLLEALDVEYMKALEEDDKDKIAEIKVKKKELRDVTDHPDLNTALTPEELKKVWPLEGKV